MKLLNKVPSPYTRKFLLMVSVIEQVLAEPAILFVNGDSVGLYRYSFVDDGEQSSFAWPQKKKKKSRKD